MRELYDQLIVEGEGGIRRLIQERTQEGLQLDFKQKRNPALGNFDEDDKKILAKAVSGFANSAGGLIVWGVNAKPGPDGVDCALSPAAPIGGIERFKSEATTLVGQLIQPRHDGVHVAAIASDAGDGSGFLLVYVERSERRPHRSEARGQKQYFKRAGDSFFEMEHYDIEDAFARESAATLEFGFKLQKNYTSGVDRDYELQIILSNVSSVIARFPYLSIFLLRGIGVNSYVSASRSHGLKHVQSTDKYHFLGGSDDVIHPGMSLSVATLDIKLKLLGGDLWVTRDQAQNEVVSFAYSIGCEGRGALGGQFKMSATGIALARP